MSGSNGRRPPLVADRRYGAPPARKTTPAKAKSGGGGGRPPAPRRRKKRDPLSALVAWVFGLVWGIFRFVWRIVWGIGWRIAASVGLVVGLSSYYFYSQLPEVSQLVDGRARGSVTMLDRDGKVFAWRGETFGGMITSDSVSDHLRDAVVATEDRRFYGHFGISPRGIASAIKINLSEGRGPLEGNGGSTITQQVAKLLCLGVTYDPKQWKSEAEYEADCRRGGIWRKVKEVPFAFAMEAKYSKAEILTIYFNRAYLGAGARGFEAAAQRYFGKSANVVNAAEAAMLAGLLKAPSYYAPTANLERARDRANVIIGLMEEQGYLTRAEADKARRNPAQLSEAAQSRSGGFFADWVMESGPTFLTKDTTEDVIIRTTLDQRLQKAAESALADVFATKVSAGSKAQAAVVVMSADGAVRAMVGGRKVEAAGAFNRATQALRQTGSAFKPFIYAAAMDLGYSPADFVDDSPLTVMVKGSGPWTPANYDREFRGLVTLTTALKQSLNIPAVRITEAVGRDKVRQVATEFGIKSDLAAGPALALGVSEATLLEMTGAYAGILNGGSAVRPYGLLELKLQGDDQPLIGQEGGIGERVISEKAARLLTYMMTQVIESGTGTRARIPGWEAAGKTGTTQAARDAWFVGFTADYVAGVWMGYDDNTPLKGVTGGGLPAEIWHEVMLRVHEGLVPRPLEKIVPEPRLPPRTSSDVRTDPVPQDTGDWQAAPAPRDTGDWMAAPRPPSAGEQIVRDVLGIFGGGRN
ncbi:PBP1A family penicillin-binding protein [Cereibacter sphaeroides]|uniref:transglycosylase domain-containing protein n=1 Tax=Cereibacter sphaeroides TaxID=1063 RepID=UPI001F3E192B|nr:PBP1A family penicillin-binding protein [Cereibacter sphaeroides]MCE6959926.1 PBP1A family penicillin-binding protein [Cereibacter sphaeroides]MCE6973011.1 PBP1A family penicillin-binding protein [Cereibacter sphaeroides]